MDHSPSEQITDRDEIYTTVIIVSPQHEHSELATAMGVRLRPAFGVLRKWAGSKKAYKQKFSEVFVDELSRLPVFVFAISAARSTIVASRDHFIERVGLGSLFNWSSSADGKSTLTFGPYLTYDTHDAEQFVHISENRALMVLFIFHFFARVFSATQDAVSPDLTWDVFMDKFPGGVDGSMATLFSCLLDFSEAGGRCSRGHFLDSDVVGTDLLADNLAGFFSGLAISKRNPPKVPLGGGNVYWERWGEVPKS
jgi:hypothetical protein